MKKHFTCIIKNLKIRIFKKKLSETYNFSSFSWLWNKLWSSVLAYFSPLELSYHIQLGKMNLKAYWGHTASIFEVMPNLFFCMVGSYLIDPLFFRKKCKQVWRTQQAFLSPLSPTKNGYSYKSGPLHSKSVHLGWNIKSWVWMWSYFSLKMFDLVHRRFDQVNWLKSFELWKTIR